MPKITFAKLAQLVGLIIKKFVTMHGHTNAKFSQQATNRSRSIPVMHCAVTCFWYPKGDMGSERVIQQMACVCDRITGVELSNPLIPTAQEIAAFQIKLR